MPWTRSQVDAIIVAEKAPRSGRSPRWVAQVKMGVTVQHQLPAFSVRAHGMDTALLVRGEDNGQGRKQIMLQVVPGGHQQPFNVARLCLTAIHGDHLHWHWHEQVPGLEGDRSEEAVSHPYGSLDRNDLLYDVFLPRLKIRCDRPLIP